MRAVAFLLFALLIPGCSSPLPGSNATPTVSDATTSSYNDTVTLPPRGSQEVNFFMQDQAQVRIVLHANVPMDWDLHSHKGTAVDTWEEGADVKDVDVTFTAEGANVYSVWLKSASSGTTVVRVNLTGAFEIEA